jgi:hypothetical protein
MLWANRVEWPSRRCEPGEEATPESRRPLVWVRLVCFPGC